MSDEESRKVSYDARLAYYQVLEKILSALKDANTEGDQVKRLRAMWSTYTMVRAYVKTSDADAIRSKIVEARKYSLLLNDNKARAGAYAKIQLLLDEAEEEIHESAKSLFLPVGGEDSDEPNWDELMKR